MRDMIRAVSLLVFLAFGAIAVPRATWAAQPASETVPALREVRVGLLSLEAPAGSERMLDALAARARDILPEVERELGVRPASRFRILLIPPGRITHPELLALDEAVTPWAAGFMFPERRVGAIRVEAASQYPYGTLEAVLAHEVTHQLLHDALGDSLPLWFNEGVSTWEGRRWSLQDMMVYTRSLLTTGLPPLADLDGYFHASAGEASLAYAASFSFVSWNVAKHGRSLMRDVIRNARDRSFAGAWEVATGEPLAKAESSWRLRSLVQYRWIPVIAGSGTLWIGITFLFMLVGIKKRGDVKEIRKRWEREERAEQEAGIPFGEESGVEPVEQPKDIPRLTVIENPSRTYGSVPRPEPEDPETLPPN